MRMMVFYYSSVVGAQNLSEVWIKQKEKERNHYEVESCIRTTDSRMGQMGDINMPIDSNCLIYRFLTELSCIPMLCMYCGCCSFPLKHCNLLTKWLKELSVCVRALCACMRACVRCVCVNNLTFNEYISYGNVSNSNNENSCPLM